MSEIRYYNGDPDDLDGLTRDEVRERTFERYEEAEDAYEELLDEVYGEVTLGQLSWPAGRVIREMDPIAFRVGVSDETAEVDLDDFPEDDGEGD